MLHSPMRLAALAVAFALSAAPGWAQTPPAPSPPAPSASPAPAPSPEPTASHLAAANELIEVIGVLGPLDELIPSFATQIQRQNVTRPELEKDLGEVLKSLGPELELQRREVTNRVARTYTKWLTEEEMRQLSAFFKTPVGAKFNKIQPDLVEEVVGVVGAWSQEVSEYVMVRTRAEMGRRGFQLQ